MRPVADRFWFKVDVRGPDECWLWLGARNQGGYGWVRGEGSAVLAHRQAWELANGPIPDGMFVCHRCDNPPCCNPGHLFLGSAGENNADRDAKGRSARLVGESNGFARLTAEQVVAIRQRYSTGTVSQISLADEFSVSRTEIGLVVRGHRWRHVGGARTSLKNAGVRNGAAKLSEAQVAEIRGRYARETVSQTALAREYGVSQSVVSDIVHGRSWRETSSVH